MSELVDMHSHILFGLDDGAQTIADSADMLRAAKKAQVTAIVATPHVRNKRFDINRAKENFLQLKELAQPAGIQLSLGYEVNCSALADIGFAHAGRYCSAASMDLLLEFENSILPVMHERLIYNLQREGLHVIIAHPERYAAVQDDITRAKRWADMGCDLQIDAQSLRQSIFSRERKCALQLLKRNLVHMVASDAHCARDYEQFKRAVEKLGEGEFLVKRQGQSDAEATKG
ncbi:MAG: tyrosine-protein phosphatase [Christensenellales bacterium]